MISLGYELSSDNVYSRKDGVGHDDAINDHTRQVQLPCTLWSIAEGQDELGRDEQHTGISQDGEEDGSNVVAKGVHLRICQAAGNEVKGEIEVGEREVREQELDGLVYELDEEENLASNGVIRRENLASIDNGIDGSEKGAVEPSSTLRDELGHGIWRDESETSCRRCSRIKLTRHVRLASTTLDIFEHPTLTSLSHQLPT